MWLLRSPEEFVSSPATKGKKNMEAKQGRIFMGQHRSGIITSVHIPLTWTQSYVTFNYKGDWEIIVAVSPESWRTRILVNSYRSWPYQFWVLQNSREFKWYHFSLQCLIFNSYVRSLDPALGTRDTAVRRQLFSLWSLQHGREINEWESTLRCILERENPGCYVWA